MTTETDTSINTVTPPVTAPAIDELQCRFCPVRKDTKQGRIMHEIRVHTGNYKDNRRTGERLSKEELTRRKNIRQKKYRDANIAKGLTAAGYPRKDGFRKRAVRGRAFPPSSSKEAKRQYYKNLVKRYHSMGLNAHGEPYKLEPNAVKKIQRAQKKRRLKERQKAIVTQVKRYRNFEKERSQVKHRRKIFVYPIPEDRAPEPAPTSQVTSPAPLMQHCPKCGEHLTRWKFV